MRIDRFPVSQGLLLNMPGQSQKILTRPLSDHFLICLDPGGIKWVLHLLQMTTNNSNLIISNPWLKLYGKTMSVKGQLVTVLPSNSILTEKIKIWTKDVEKAEENDINSLMRELDILEKAECASGLSPTDRERKNSLKMELANKLNLEAFFWKQKAREKWLKDGDKNTKYFHYFANYKNAIYMEIHCCCICIYIHIYI